MATKITIGNYNIFPFESRVEAEEWRNEYHPKGKVVRISEQNEFVIETKANSRFSEELGNKLPSFPIGKHSIPTNGLIMF